MRSSATILAVALAVHGSDRDTPEFVLLGTLRIVASFVIGVRTAHRRGRSLSG